MTEMYWIVKSKQINSCMRVLMFYCCLPSGLSSKSSSSSSDPTEYSDWLSERSSCHSEPHIKEKQYIAFASVGGHLRAPWHCSLLQTTTAGHAHTVLYHFCPPEVRWELSTLPDNHFKLRVYSKLWWALKSLHSYTQLLWNCGCQDHEATLKMNN